MIKRILLPLDASPFTAAATEAACVLARDQGARITGLVVLDVPGIEKSIGPVPLGAGHYAKRLEGSRREEAEKLVDELDRLSQVGNDTLRPRLLTLLGGNARQQLVARVRRAHEGLPALDDDYRQFLTTELDA